MSYFSIPSLLVKSSEEDAFLRLSNNVRRCNNLLIRNKLHSLSNNVKRCNNLLITNNFYNLFDNVIRYSNLLVNNNLYSLSNFIFSEKSEISLMLPLIAKNHDQLINYEDQRKLQRYLVGYKINILNYLNTIPNKSLPSNYAKLSSIDPNLVGKQRYNQQDYFIIKIIKTAYYVFKIYFFKKTIEKYENRITMLSFLERVDKNLKKISKLSQEVLGTDNVTNTLKYVINDLIKNESKEDEKTLKNYLKQYLDEDMHYLLNHEILTLFDSIITKINSNTTGFATYKESIESSVVTFPSSTTKKKLNDTISLSVGAIDETQTHMNEWSYVKSSPVQMIPTNHCAHTQQWRKKLILAAKHNVIISGNYCSGKAFDEILDLVKSRLEENTELKVVILCHPDFIIENKKKGIRNTSLLKKLTTSYPDRFALIHTGLVTIKDEINGNKTTTNHTKYLGIDYGRYYILGGSGIKDNFNLSGVDNYLSLLGLNFNKEFTQLNTDLLEIKECSQDLPLQKIFQVIEFSESLKEKILQHPHYSSIEGGKIIKLIDKNIAILQKAKESSIINYQELKKITSVLCTSFEKTESGSNPGLLNWVIPGNFRDMDFVFSDVSNDDHSSGRKAFLEIVRLAYRWEALNEARNPTSTLPVYSPKKVSLLPIFNGGKKIEITHTDSVIQRIMKEPMLKPSLLKTDIITEGFQDSQTGNIQILSQGPEDSKGQSKFATKTLELIEKAKKNIFFNHMYFCPTHEIMEALRNAAQKGIKIEIITSGVTKNCTISQAYFGNYNQWHWVQLCSMVPPEYRDNIQVYLYEQNKKALHKKVIIIDEEIVLAGSSNFGYKSLVCSSDFEINFVATSQDFAQKTLAIYEEDKALSKKIENKNQMSPKEYIKAFLYSLAKENIN